MKQNTLFKRIAAGALALSLVLAVTPPAGAEELTDVSSSAWYAEAVNYCCQRDLLLAGEDGSFSPEGELTRAMVAHALYQLADQPEVDLTPEEFDSGEDTAGQSKDKKQDKEEPPEPVSPFTDVPLDAPDADAIFWAWQEGFVDGYDDGRFGPDDLVTREQLSVILWRSMGSPLPQVSARFEDRPVIARWAINGVEWAHEQGLISGKPGNLFDPQGTATRAEGAVILMNYDLAFIHPPESPEPGPLQPNTYDSSKFSVRNGFLTYQGEAPSYVGVDVSSHQKEIDWARVAAAGVDFAMIRVGYRGYSVGSINKDAYFEDNIRGALDNGLEVGVYFFSQAMTPEEAQEEALQTLEWISGYDITYPVVFDWEQVDSDSSRTRDADGKTTTECAQVFCNLVEEAGYTAMTYGSPSKIYAGGLQLEELTQYPFWLAHYTKDWNPSSFRYHYHMWQYSSSGSVDGIEGRVDLDLCLTDWKTWKEQ